MKTSKLTLMMFIFVGCVDAFGADRFILISVPHVPGAADVRAIPSVDCDMLSHILVDAFDIKTSAITILDSCKVAEQGGGIHGAHENCSSSAASIRTELESLAKTTSPGDRILIYFSGHGTKRQVLAPKSDEPDGCDEMLVACDFRPQTFEGAILDDDVDAILSELSDRHVHVIIDACFSGSATKATGPGWILDRVSVPTMLPKFMSSNQSCDLRAEMVDQDVDYVAMLSSSENEFSYWTPSDGVWKSVFTRNLVKGLAGYADGDKSGSITYEELFTYLRERMGRNAGRKQTPRFFCPPDLRDKPIFGYSKPTLLPRVAAVQGDEIRITRGEDQGVHEGDVYDVWRDGERIDGAGVHIKSVGDRSAKGLFLSKVRVRSGDLLSLSPASVVGHDTRVWLFSKDKSDDVDRAIIPILSSLEGVRLVPKDRPMDADLLIDVSPANRAWVCEIFDMDTMAPISYFRKFALKDVGPALTVRFKGQKVANRLSKLERASRRPRIRFEIDGGNRPFRTSTDPSKQDKVRFVATGLVDSYVTLISIDKMGEISSALTPEPVYVRAGERQLIKPAKHSHYIIRPPAGRDLVFAVVADRPVSVTDILALISDSTPLDSIRSWDVSKLIIWSVLRSEDE